jgi:uncharacterized protein YggT (Ycf19 family)
MFKLLRDLLAFTLIVVELLLAIRFVLRLLGASPSASFVEWIYETTKPLLQPFLFAFPTPSVKGGFVLEFTTLFALFAYAFIGYVIQEVLAIIDRNDHKK